MLQSTSTTNNLLVYCAMAQQGMTNIIFDHEITWYQCLQKLHTWAWWEYHLLVWVMKINLWPWNYNVSDHGHHRGIPFNNNLWLVRDMPRVLSQSPCFIVINYKYKFTSSNMYVLAMLSVILSSRNLLHMINGISCFQFQP